MSLAAAVVALALGSLPFFRDVELKTYDWRMRLTARPSGPAEDIVLVSIDDDSVRRMAPLVGRWPWPRLVHAFVVDFLAAAPAKLIVYDILFTEPHVGRFMVGDDEWTGAESDAAFAEAVRNAGTVILGADVEANALLDPSRALEDTDDRPRRTYDGPIDCIEPRPLVVLPIAELDRAARGIGHTRLWRDDDGPLRRNYPFARVGDRIVPSLSSAALLALGDSAPAQPRACPPLIPYRGPTVGPNGEHSFREYSAYTLIRSQQQRIEGVAPELDPAVFKDKIVVVSATASGTYEVQASPFGQGIAGGEVHANIIDALLRGRAIAPMRPWSAIALSSSIALILGVLGARLTVWPLAASAGVAALLVTWWSVRAFASGTWTPLVTPLLVVCLAFVGQLGWQYFVEGREKRQVKRLFSRFVPRDVYNQLMEDPARAALGGKRRHMTVLFSDVRGFTAMSENAAPEEVVGQLNEYFSRMVQVLFDHHGTLDKFVGDMVMGLFGAPLDDPDHADHAVQAAIAMSHGLDALNREWAAAGKPQLDIGIGIATGDMVAGNIGSNTIMSYTVIGDTVNLGARLESLNKEFGTRIIVSEATAAELKGRYDMRPLGTVTVKGRARPVAIFEVKPL